MENWLKCPKCPQNIAKIYASKRSLKFHLLLVHCEEKNLVCVRDNCKFNGKTFKSKEVLRRHLKVCGSTNKTYTCIHCGKIYQTRHRAKEHQSICKSGPNCPWKCEVLTCSSSFVTKNGLERHVKSRHLKERVLPVDLISPSSSHQIKNDLDSVTVHSNTESHATPLDKNQNDYRGNDNDSDFTTRSPDKFLVDGQDHQCDLVLKSNDLECFPEESEEVNVQQDKKCNNRDDFQLKLDLMPKSVIKNKDELHTSPKFSAKRSPSPRPSKSKKRPYLDEVMQKELMTLTQSLSSSLKPGTSFCSNLTCNTKTNNLFDAPLYSSMYVRLPQQENLPCKICWKCICKVNTLHEQSKRLLKYEGNLFSMKYEGRVHSDDRGVELVTLDDENDGGTSEPELQSQTQHCLRSVNKTPSNSEETSQGMMTQQDDLAKYSVSEACLDSILSDSLARFNLRDQAQKCSETLAAEADQLSDEFADLMKQAESTADSITSIFRKLNNHLVKESIVELGTADMNITDGTFEIKAAEDLPHQLASLGEDVVNLKRIPKAVTQFLETVTDKRRCPPTTKDQAGHVTKNKGSRPVPQADLPRYQDLDKPITLPTVSTSLMELKIPRGIVPVRVPISTEDIRRKLVLHDHCSPACCPNYKEDNFRKFGLSPLTIPLYLGWNRAIVQHCDPWRGPVVVYISPCGRQLASYKAIHAYNRLTENDIPIEFFCLNTLIDSTATARPTKSKFEISEDISNGQEWTPVPCVNSIDKERPPNIYYTSQRIFSEDVDIPDDDGFLVCCECEDDCRDKEKCACWQLTLSGASFKEKNGPRGYENRRLQKFVGSAIYECNHKCKCNTTTCLNRVVQNKMIWPMELFKTEMKGWGVRALHDIPKGSFICTYSGKIYSDAGANEVGLEYGDEYFADLDFIDYIEKVKEGYEPFCLDLESESEGEQLKSNLGKGNVSTANKAKAGPCKDQGDQAKTRSKPQVARKSGCGVRLKTSQPHIPDSKTNGTLKDSTPPSSSGIKCSPPLKNANCLPDLKKTAAGRKDAALHYRSYFGKTNKLFGRPYVVDGKKWGNLGRFFNHSCDPNLFIQTVFVDTHDLRFPWIAFFTSQPVKAGTELCWDYKYDVGSVPGRNVRCFCLSENCAGRLL